MATYGRCYELVDPSNPGWGVEALGPCEAGPWTREPGFYSYYEVRSLEELLRG